MEEMSFEEMVDDAQATNVQRSLQLTFALCTGEVKN